MSKDLPQELHAYLNAEEAEFHSSGGWTQILDPKRRQHRATQLLSGLWLVKLLQAAQASGADDFRVKHQGDKTTACFVPKAPPRGRAAAHLQIAWQMLAAANRGAVNVQLGGQTFSIDPQTFELREDAQTKTAGPELSVTLSASGLPWDIVARRRRRLSDRELLSGLGRFATLSILHDEQRINDPMPHKAQGMEFVPTLHGSLPRPAFPYTAGEAIFIDNSPRTELLALVDLTQKPVMHRTGRQGRTLQQAEQIYGYLQHWVGEFESLLGLQLWLERNRPAYDQFDSELEPGGWLQRAVVDRELRAMLVRGYVSCDLNSGEVGQLYLIQDGVIVKQFPLGAHYPRCLAIWSAPEVKTDWSSLQAVEDETFGRILAQVDEAFRELAYAILTRAREERHWSRLSFHPDRVRAREWAQSLIGR